MNSMLRSRAKAALLIVVVMVAVPAALVSCSGGGGGGSTVIISNTSLLAAPASIIATAISGSRVDISWSVVPGATSYKVFRSTTSNVYSLPIAQPATTLYSDTSVTVGPTYYYVVRAVNSKGESKNSAEVSATPSAPSGTVTIQGTITYEDKEYGLQGMTGVTMFKPVRYADVELVNTSGTIVMLTSKTSSTGLYSFTTTSADAGKTVYVRVSSSATPVGSTKVNVKNFAAIPDTYHVVTTNFTLTGSINANVAVPTTSPADGAFNILDVYTSGMLFVSAYSVTAPPSLNAYWQQNNGYGTFFCNASSGCTNGAGIYVLNDPQGLWTGYGPDTDEFDDDVLWHEFGHFILDAFSKDSSPGGPHHLNDNTQDMRLSWSEGWGNFTEAAIKSWLKTNYPQGLSTISTLPVSQYVDTAPGGYYISLTLSNPESSAYPCTVGGLPTLCNYCSNDECYYSTNEISVANTLLSVMSGTQALGMKPIWDAAADQRSLSALTPANIDTFYDALVTRNAATVSTINSIFLIRNIDYRLDSAATFTYTGTPQYRTLYPAGNSDQFFFTPSAPQLYTIQTATLRNGADTYLKLYQSDCVTLATVSVNANDNMNGTTWVYGFNYDYFTLGGIWVPAPANTTTMLASRVTASLSAGTTYCVSVSSSSARPLSAGRYGSYYLTISP